MGIRHAANISVESLERFGKLRELQMNEDSKNRKKTKFILYIAVDDEEYSN